MTPEERAAQAIERTGASSQQRESVAAAIREAIAEEREACALLAYQHPAPMMGASWRESIACAIRARGKP